MRQAVKTQGVWFCSLEGKRKHMKTTQFIYHEFCGVELAQSFVLDFQAKTIRQGSAWETSTGKRKGEQTVALSCSDLQWRNLVRRFRKIDFPSLNENGLPPFDSVSRWQAYFKNGDRIVDSFSGEIGYTKKWGRLRRFKSYCHGFFIDQMECDTKPLKCPYCGSSDIRPYLSAESARAISEDDKYLVDGCVVPDHSPAWGCAACGVDFYKIPFDDEYDLDEPPMFLPGDKVW